MTITHELKIDLVRPAILPPVAVVQGDTYTREVQISLYAAGVAWELPEGHDVAIRYSKPDGTAGKYDTMPDGSMAWRSEGNTVNIMLCPQMLTVPGVVPAQVSITLAERTVSTFTFSVCVEPDASKGALTSENYINWHTAFLPQLTGAKPGQFLMIAEVDEKGKVVALEAVDAPSGGNGSDSGGNADQSGLTQAQITALDGMFKICAYTADAKNAYKAFQNAFGIGGEVEPNEPDVPVVPDEPDTEKTLTSISAVYSGGSVTAGTAVTALTGIVVTAHYSDGTSATVTGYTLSGTISEGNNTITVSYGGKTATFTVTGTAESGGGGEPIDAYTAYNWTDGVYLVWNASTNVASETANANMTASEYIGLDGVTKIEAAEISGKNLAQYNVIFYDENKTGISSTSGYVRKDNSSYPSPANLAIPEGAAFVRFCGQIAAITADGTTNTTLKYYIYK